MRLHWMHAVHVHHILTAHLVTVADTHNLCLSMTAITCAHSRPFNCHHLQLHVLSAGFTTRLQLFMRSTPLFHFPSSIFHLSTFKLSFYVYPLTHHVIDIRSNEHIQLFQLSTALLFNLPHLSFVNFDCAQHSSSLCSTQVANCGSYFLNSSTTTPYSTPVGAYAILLNTSFNRSFDT